MAVAVVGMHRSGTSMVTRMLAACGLQLGPLHELIGPSSENPAGYWERRPIVALDDALLEVLGMAWDHAPHPLDADWLERPDVQALLGEARELVAGFGTDATWGWKDPRSSFTVPFWEAAIGSQVAVVVCARNPLDVAESLERRGRMSERLAIQLWQAYTEAALGLRTGRRHVVTHYDAYFADPHAEVARVCQAVGLAPTAEQVAVAAASADTSHRHSSHGLAALVESAAPAAAVATYLELLAEAGPTMTQVAAGDALSLEVDDEGFDRAEAQVWVERFRSGARG